MPIRIYNTLTGAKEEFKPITEGKVKMYVCGPTVYDSSHIGHARAAVVFDVIVRHLKRKGFDVTYVRNYTDVDDKVINKANAEKIDFKLLADRYIDEYERDMNGLGVAQPDHKPRVTEHMDGIIKMVATLIERGHAYESGGDVFYDVKSFADYGKLSKRDSEQMTAGVRVDVNERKRYELDFALWKSAKPGEPSWDSPWGKGRPGWHIECSAMSSHYLGQPFDIHGGGVDLVFPHHENEIAQSEGAAGAKFCNYWIHNGHVSSRGEKISKSLGNFIPIPELIKRWNGEAIRIFLLSKLHSSPVDFTEEALDSAQEQVDRFYDALAASIEMKETANSTKPKPLPDSGEQLKHLLIGIDARFTEAMDEDFNTALAMGYLFEALRALNRFLAEADAKCVAHAELAYSASEKLRELGNVLGLMSANPADFIMAKLRKAIEKIGVSEQDIQIEITKRAEARKNKDWKEADRIRDELIAKGIILKDGAKGTAWTVK